MLLGTNFVPSGKLVNVRIKKDKGFFRQFSQRYTRVIFYWAQTSFHRGSW